MKKVYRKPLSLTILMTSVLMQEASTTNGNIHIDDPQDPGGALSDENSDFWDDYE